MAGGLEEEIEEDTMEEVAEEVTGLSTPALDVVVAGTIISEEVTTTDTQTETITRVREVPHQVTRNSVFAVIKT